MKFRIDLHVHSKYSGDTASEPEETIERAISLDLQGIVFTEHYLYAASEHAEGLKEKYNDRILILRGVEFSTEEGHCLIFGVDTDRLALRYAPVEDVVRIVTLQGGVIIPSHPYRRGNSLGDRIHDLNGITALEGYNGNNMHAFNVRAIEAARVLNLPFTGGSDAHEACEAGSCYTEFNDKVTSDNFIDLLKKGNYQGADTRKVSRWIF
jgi:predicted metal-dependent phosphoesterase TrpH